jgi:hypothetical protein
MSVNLPPSNLEELSTFNPSFFNQVETGGVSKEYADSRYLIKVSADTATAQENFSAGIIVQDISTGTGTMNIGTAGSNTINIGGTGSTVNVFGSTTYLDITNLQVEDKNILVNKTGVDCTGAGISVEKDGGVISQFITDSVGDWIVETVNDRLYLNQIQEKTAGNKIVVLSDLDINSNDIENVGSLKGQPNASLILGNAVDAGSTDIIDFWTSGTRKGQILSSGQMSLTSNIASTSLTSGTLLTAGGIGCSGSLSVKNGIAMQTSIGSVPAPMAYFDNNRTAGVIVPIPTGVQPQCLEFPYCVDLTAGSASTILTITHSDTTNTERFIYLGVECSIFGCTTSETCLRVQNQNILLCCSNSTSGFQYTNGVRDTVVNNQTNAGVLALGTTTFALGTNTTTSTGITLSQSFTTGTPSTALYARGVIRMFSGNSTGLSNFITELRIG